MTFAVEEAGGSKYYIMAGAAVWAVIKVLEYFRHRNDSAKAEIDKKEAAGQVEEIKASIREARNNHVEHECVSLEALATIARLKAAITNEAPDIQAAEIAEARHRKFADEFCKCDDKKMPG